MPKAHRIPRLFSTVLASATLLLAGCAPSAAPPAPSAPAPSAPAAPTAAPAPRPSPTHAAATPAPRPPSALPTAIVATPVGAAKRGGVLLIGTIEDPPTYDVHQETSTNSLLALRNNYEGLIKYHYLRQNEIVGELAEKWAVSQDGLTYTFQLRKGVTWHDGKPFTAEDAAFSLMRAAYPDQHKIVSPRVAALLTAVEKVDVVDPSTINIKLKFTSASFLQGLATDWPLIMPKHTIQAKGDMKRDVNGTGPFTLARHDRGVSVELKRYAGYWDKDLPYMDGITFYVIPDDSTRFAAFRTGRIRMTYIGQRAMTPDQAETIKKEMAGRATVKEHAAFTRLVFMMNTAKKPWSDVRVRRAVHLALDRQNLIKLNDNLGVMGAALHPFGAWGLTPDELSKMPGYRQPKTQDIADAKKLMADAGYANGFKTTMLNRTGRAGRLAPAVKEQLAAVGIDVQIDNQEQSAIQVKMNAKNIDTVWWGYAEPIDDPDPPFAAIYATNGPRNSGSFSDAELDAMFQEQQRTLDVTKRKQIARKMQERVLELAAYPVGFWDVYQRGFWNEVKDFIPGPGPYVNLKLDRVWLDK